MTCIELKEEVMTVNVARAGSVVLECILIRQYTALLKTHYCIEEKE